MNQYFIMDFMNQEMLLPKTMVKFDHGLGIVNTIFLQDGDYYHTQLFGIVNKHYQPIIPLFPYVQLKKISILNENNIILILEEDGFFNLYHITIENKKVIWNYLFYLDYVNINNEVLHLVDNQNRHVLYRVKDRKIIYPSFNYLSEFQYDEEIKDTVAVAVYLTLHHQILSYINLDGQVVAPYLDNEHNIYYDASMSFDEVLEIVTEDERGNER